MGCYNLTHCATVPVLGLYSECKNQDSVIEDSCSGNQKESGVLVEERRQAVDEMGVAGPDYTGLGS